MSKKITLITVILFSFSTSFAKNCDDMTTDLARSMSSKENPLKTSEVKNAEDIYCLFRDIYNIHKDNKAKSEVPSGSLKRREFYQATLTGASTFVLGLITTTVISSDMSSFLKHGLPYGLDKKWTDYYNKKLKAGKKVMKGGLVLSALVSVVVGIISYDKFMDPRKSRFDYAVEDIFHGLLGIDEMADSTMGMHYLKTSYAFEGLLTMDEDIARMHIKESPSLRRGLFQLWDALEIKN